MREIIFRGKRVDNGEWVHGTLNNVLDEVPKIQYVVIKHGMMFLTVFDVIPETVGQYTGLKDKNGRKVFEGDILSGYLDDLFPEEESRYEVIWHDYGWHIKSSDGIFDTMEQNWINMFLEVIGNIHDNKNLLKNQEVGE